jgi:hypothetical protein
MKEVRMGGGDDGVDSVGEVEVGGGIIAVAVNLLSDWL